LEKLVEFKVTGKVPAHGQFARALAAEYMRIARAYLQATGKTYDANIVDQLNLFDYSVLAGEDGKIQPAEVNTQYTALRARVKALRKKTGKPHADLELRTLNYTKEDSFEASAGLEVTPDQEDALKKLDDKYKTEHGSSPALVYVLAFYGQIGKGKLPKGAMPKIERFVAAQHAGGKK
jgi:hypothetical protein